MAEKSSAEVKAIKAVIEEIRPQLQMDGGDISFIGFKDGIVKVKLQGACSGCPMAAQTLKYGVEEYIKKKVKAVKKVVAD